MAYIARVDDFDCGIMISASHNPFYDNGIKLIDCYGEKMPEETLLLVEDYIDGKLHVFDQDWPELPFAHREHIGCTVDYVAGRNRYMGYLISLGIYSFKGIKVGLDCANGASWNIAKSVFDALGADTYVINNQPNGLNINLNAGSTHIEGLQKFVVEKGLDVGFAYDGDADRCLCVDEKGNVITGDHILYIYGCYMKERGKLLTNTVVTTVMSNFGLYKAFDEQGIGYAKTAVGDKYVYEYMAKNGCRIGGEQSGHIIFSKYASTGDGILTSLKMMEVMLAKKKPLSALAAPLKIYPQVLENVRVTDKKAAQDDAAVQAAVKAVAEALGDTGRILVRESGTEPVVRVMVEALTTTPARSMFLRWWMSSRHRATASDAEPERERRMKKFKRMLAGLACVLAVCLCTPPLLRQRSSSILMPTAAPVPLPQSAPMTRANWAACPVPAWRATPLMAGTPLAQMMSPVFPLMCRSKPTIRRLVRIPPSMPIGLPTAAARKW